MDASSALARIDEMIEAAESALCAEMGSATSCEIHKDGRVTGGMKYLEGKLVALMRIRRLVAGPAADDPEAAVVSEMASWDGVWTLRAEATNPSPPWIAYATGGLDAAHDVAELVGG